ncbi:MAG: protein kinase, partial [Gemmatimonadota bacterium]
DRYRIERELGAGGMATVYLAHDMKHDRKVAVKVLRPELAAVIGADRFLAEIKTTANLQHPHILSLFDSGTVDGTVFYVMPFVEGESLRDTLTREKQLPVDDAVRIAREVADALQYAHDHGVIHRDIKPENILLQGGHALVADFGIALAAAKVGGTRMTETGMSLGTPTYMSPEQAMGERELDARTDIYALGCVTYEMLAGEPPFTGPTAQAIVAKVVTEPAPSVQSKRPATPDAVDDAIRTALQKTPADRFRTAAEFAAALQRTTGNGHRAARVGPARRTSDVSRLTIGVALALAVAAFFLGGRLLGRGAGAPIAFGHDRHVTWDPGLEIMPVLSPDGRSIAYATGPIRAMRVMVRPVGEGRAVPLTGDTAAGETAPRWSPDGSRILFLARGGIFSAPAAGGPARPEVPGDPAVPITSATWSPDGAELAFTRGDTLFVRDRAAAVRVLALMHGPILCAWSPQGTFVACAVGNPLYGIVGNTFANKSPSRIVLARVRDGAMTTVTDSLSLNQSPVWSADGHWLFVVSDRDGPRDVYGVPLASGGTPTGPAVRLTTGLGAHTISLSANGTRLAYSRYASHTNLWQMPIPVAPPVSSLSAKRLTNANESIEVMAISPDGKWLLYDSDLTGNDDIFRVLLAGGEAEQLTTDPADDFAPAASPDGKEIVFHSWRNGASRDLYVMRLDGGGIERVTNSPRQEALAQWSPDGKALAFTDLGEFGIFTVRRDASGHWGTPRRIASDGFLPMWSPDGHWIAYVSGASGRRIGGDVIVVPADSGAARTIMSTAVPGNPIAEWPGWGKDGNIYFYTHNTHGDGEIWSVSPAGGGPRLMVRIDPVLHASARSALTVSNGNLFFASEDRQSDIWVMEIRKP